MKQKVFAKTPNMYNADGKVVWEVYDDKCDKGWGYRMSATIYSPDGKVISVDSGETYELYYYYKLHPSYTFDYAYLYHACMQTLKSMGIKDMNINKEGF